MLFGAAEVGHVHTNGMVDISFTRPVHNVLLGEGLVQQHGWVPNSSEYADQSFACLCSPMPFRPARRLANASLDPIPVIEWFLMPGAFRLDVVATTVRQGVSGQPQVCPIYPPVLRYSALLWTRRLPVS